MIVISDTSAISSLFLIAQLDLLPSIFGKIIVPRKVMEELSVLEIYGHDLSDIKTASWLEVLTVQNSEAVAILTKHLDHGESEAIILAKELHADYILMDDKLGREAALEHGLKIIGVLGILILAKQNNLILTVRQLMDDLRTKAKFRIHEKLYIEILTQVNE